MVSEMGQGTYVSRLSNSARPARGAAQAIRLKVDVPLVLVTVTLMGLGLLMVFSSSWDVSIRMGEPPMYFFWRQLMWLGVGSVAAGVLVLLDFRQWTRFALIGMLGTIGLLLIVLIFKDTTLGADRSIVGGSFRPAELAKLMTVIYLSVWLCSRKQQLSDVSFGLIPLAAILGILGGLILSQPDLSAAATIVILGGIMFFLAGGDMRQIAFLVIVAMLIGWVVVVINPTGNSRVESFMAGLKDPLESSEHVQHSLAAFVQGGWMGVGIGRSSTKLISLPVPHTDSVFAVVGEEFGVIGATLVVILFGLFLWRGLLIARRTEHELGKLLAAGLTLWIVMEAFMNMMAMTGLMPFAGNALPFFSVGGSSLVFTLVAVGVLLNISRLSEQDQQEAERRSFSEVVNLRWWDRRRDQPRPRRARSAKR